MEAVIFDIKRFAIHDGPGIRVSIFFKGCPLSCGWCHNPEGMSPMPERFTELVPFDGTSIRREVSTGRTVTVEELCREVEKDLVFIRETAGGVTFTGGEPLLQDAFLEVLTGEMKQRGIHTCIDTSGYVHRNVMAKFLYCTDLFLYDLKTMDDKQHIRHTGVSNRIILENLTMLADSGSRVTVRIPLVPGFNDGGEDMNRIMEFLHSLSNAPAVEILPFHSYAKSKYNRFRKEYKFGQIPEPGQAALEAVRSAFYGSGLRRPATT